VGAFLGLKLTVLVVFLSPILATVFALACLSGRSGVTTGAAGEATDSQQSRGWLMQEVPFGVFLGASGLIALFVGERIWQAYLAMVP